MARQLGNVLSGARARLLIGGTPVLYATNVNYGEEIQYDPIEVLDLLEIAEFVPVRYRATFTSQHVRVVNQPIKDRDGIQIFPKLSEILQAGDLEASVEDAVTGLTLSKIQRVKASRYTINIGATGIVLTDVEFVAIRIKDESPGDLSS